MIAGAFLYLSKEECKDQESIKSKTTPDLGHRMRKHTRKYHIQETQEVSPFPVGDHKAARNRPSHNKRYFVLKLSMKIKCN